ncbi:MAG TPA: MBL fold metallo-hydrolase [Spirochaetia bacterium]|nr:MAG: hypothetical protein A2Y41_06955 [Spirochaetes bacterium GWB1_36_13]HCL55752.1 MBL fold metallo-hydrolase [Spirochaetia bacterium]
MSFKLRFWGVRGSYPATGKAFGTGGNTTCLEIEAGNATIIIDAGTGIIRLGKEIMKRMAAQKKDSHQAFMFFTHYHQDHNQGLPFFVPLYNPRYKINFLGPTLGSRTMLENLNINMYIPFFPVNFEETGCKKDFFNINENQTVVISPDDPSSFQVCEKHLEIVKPPEPEKIKISINKNFIHPKDGCLYYTIEYKGKKVTFATDVEGFVGGDQRLIAASKNADYLIHDSQYLPEVYLNPFFPTQGFGHATPLIAADVARQAGVKTLVLTHHDPESDDQRVKKIQTLARKSFKNTIYAYEVMEIDVIENKISPFTRF